MSEPTRDDYGRKLHHQTSVDGYQDVKKRAPSQKIKLLTAFAGASFNKGLTSEEAWEISGLHARAEFWARCGELEKDGYIDFIWLRPNCSIHLTRPGASGDQRNVYRITEQGLDLLVSSQREPS